MDEDGVRLGDWLESREEGDAVPSLGSFFLEPLPGSLPRDSYTISIETCADGQRLNMPTTL